MGKKKLAYISSSTIPSLAANSVHVMKMCQAFANNNYDVTLYSINSRKDVRNYYQYYGVEKVFEIESILSGEWKDNLIIKKNVIRSNQIPDVFYGRNLYGLLGAVSFNKPIIYEAHQFNKENLFVQYLHHILFTNSNFKHLVTISEALKNEYLSNFPYMDEKKIFVAHDGADLPYKEKNKENTFLIGGRDNTYRIGYVGQLYKGKGMEIISRLSLNLPQFDFHVIGGSKDDIEYWKSKCINTNIYFHGYVPHGDLQKFFSSLDIVLAPYQKKVSVYGNRGDVSKWMSPLKIFEYMSNKLPIVASDLPVLKEVLTSEVNCLLCNPDKLDEWEKAVLRLIEDNNLRTKLAERAYSSFISRYTWFQRAKIVLG